jgi:L-fuculose-phosphate aldolase
VGKEVLEAYYKLEVVEHFAEISFMSRLLGGERLLPRSEVSRLLSLRKGVYKLEGPPGGEACPIPAEEAGSVGTAAGADGNEMIQLSRDELVTLISDAIRAVGGARTA